ncbi:MAG: tRNA (adenosine(37)-N6)-dimethylallyltransferase MiaA [Pseudomonadota bacterium]
MALQEHLPLIVIAGPTASGKSAAALALAETIGGEVICADSMQVYRDLAVLSARPTANDEARAPHHLYGYVDGSERYSAGRFAREAKPVIEDVRMRGQVPILCGGTGLYLKAMTDGLSPIPEVAQAITEALNAEWLASPDGLRSRLLSVDPEMERLEPADQQRHIRALAVFDETGRPLSDWQKEPRVRAVEGPVLPLVLCPGREALYRRCEARFEAMLARGALDEARVLAARGLAPDLPVMKALGVPELLAYLSGELSLEDAAASAKQETRRFAKRQMTWFRNQTDWRAFEDKDALVAHARAAMDVP